MPNTSKQSTYFRYGCGALPGAVKNGEFYGHAERDSAGDTASLVIERAPVSPSHRGPFMALFAMRRSELVELSAMLGHILNDWEE